MKRITKAMVALILCFIVTACGGGGGSTSSTSTTPTTPDSTPTVSNYAGQYAGTIDYNLTQYKKSGVPFQADVTNDGQITNVKINGTSTDATASTVLSSSGTDNNGTVQGSGSFTIQGITGIVYTTYTGKIDLTSGSVIITYNLSGGLSGTITVAGLKGASIANSSSLALSLDKTSVASGSPITATITLSSKTGSPTNGIRVRVTSSDPSIIDTLEGYTNSSGIATLTLPTKWTNSDKTISVVANADGIMPSNALTLKLLAPKLTCSIPAEITTSWNNNFAFIGKTIVSNYQLKFVDGSGNPIPNQVISLYIDSLTNKGINDQIVFTPLQGSMIIAPPGVFTGTTDQFGIIIIPMYIQMSVAQPLPCTTNPTTGAVKCTGTVQSKMTANWRAVAQSSGQTLTTTGTSLITFTNTGI